MSALVEIRDLSIALPPDAERRFAVDGVSLDIARGEVLCLVGESGSGKSVLAASIAGILPGHGLAVRKGSIRFDGEDVTRLGEVAFRRLRGRRIGFIFQEPMTALNPVLTVGDQIDEAVKMLGRRTKTGRRARVLELAQAVRLPDPEGILHRFPHQLSGGQRQRVMIAIAIANEPDLLIADEPTTALDVTTQAEVLALIAEIRRRLRLAVLFITHDFGLVADIAERVAVMQQGRVVESGPTADVLGRPQHPYTQRLIAAVPAFAPRSPRPVVGRRDLLAVDGLIKTYGGRRSLFQRRRPPVHALEQINLVIHEGETVALVGESGSGKSTLAQAIVGLTTWDQGSIRFEGEDLAARRRRDGFSQPIQMVFQDPFSSLNPRHRVRRIITEAARVKGMPRTEAETRLRALLERVGLDPAAADRFPHEFSGGQRQRIALARALFQRPRLLIADEPVSALDVSIQSQVLDLLKEIRDEFGIAMLFITHDLRIAASIADRIAVMRSGRIVEEGSPRTILDNPRSAYTRRLLAAVPGLAWEAGRLAAPPLSAEDAGPPTPPRRSIPRVAGPTQFLEISER
jgi:peptide/nickel transport system ATP-binding protein